MSSTALPPPEAAAVIDRLFAALADGDVAAARACCTPDTVIWHSFDRIALDLDAACRGWDDLVANFAERSFVDVRRAAIPGGFVQQQLMVAVAPSGARLAWPVCFLVQLRDGLIARLDEYIDRAGSYAVEAGPQTTPGLPPRAA